MRNGDINQMGALINTSHASLRDDYEVSSKTLDKIVNLAQNHPSCFGARMMGAGFGGCALALLRKGDEDRFSKEISVSFQRDAGVNPNIFTVKSANGVNVKQNSSQH